MLNSVPAASATLVSPGLMKGHITVRNRVTKQVPEITYFVDDVA